jgi:hypothetical protein
MVRCSPDIMSKVFIYNKKKKKKKKKKDYMIWQQICQQEKVEQKCIPKASVDTESKLLGK